MSAAIGDIAAGAVSRLAAARPERDGGRSARPPTEPANAQPTPSGGGGRWVAVVTPESAAVIIALVSKHGVLATVPAVLPQSAKQAIPSFDVLS